MRLDLIATQHEDVVPIYSASMDISIKAKLVWKTFRPSCILYLGSQVLRLQAQNRRTTFSEICARRNGHVG